MEASSETPGALHRALGAVHRAEDGLLATLLGTMILLAAAQIVARNAFGAGFAWADPLLRALVLWVAMLGALAASRGDRHISIDVLSRLLPPRVQQLAAALAALFTSAVCALLAFHSGRLVAADYSFGGAAFAAVPMWVMELCLPFAFALIAVRYALLLVLRLRAVLGPPPA